MDYVHVLLHVQPVRAAAAVYFVAAMVGHKAIERVVLRPVLLYRVHKPAIESKVRLQRGNGLRRFGAEFVHCAVVIAVVNHHHVVAVLFYKLHGLCVYLVHGIVNIIIYAPLEEYHGYAVVAGGNERHALAGLNKVVKYGVALQNRLNVCFYAVLRGHKARVHGSEANRRYAGHNA